MSSGLNALSRTFPPWQQMFCGLLQMEALSMSEHGEASLSIPDLAIHSRHFKLLLTQREPSICV